MLALAWIPPLGSLGFVFFCLMVHKADLRYQRRMATNQERLLIRALSQASADAKSLGHWYLRLAAVAFCSAISASALWQFKVAELYDSDMDFSILIPGQVASLGLFLMSIVDTSSNTVFETIYHTLTAGMFLAGGSSYMIQMIFLADEIGWDDVVIVRIVAIIIMASALAYMMLGGFSLYYKAADKLIAHRDGSAPLSEEEQYSARKILAVFGASQLLFGVGLVLGVSTGARDAAELNTEEGTPGAILGALVFIITLIITVVAYKYKLQTCNDIY